MNITKEWLKERSACQDGYEWSLKVLNNESMDVIEFIKMLMDEEQFQWANWVIVRVFDKPNNVKYAIFASEQVIHIYEKKYPKDNRPRKAIEAAKEWLDNPTEENRDAADAAAVVNAATYATYAAADATYATYAAYAAYAAINAAAADATYAAYAAINAAAVVNAATYAAYAAYAADAADADARRSMSIKILNYGIKLLKELKDTK